jgi:putative adenylate-forming enzyme
MIRGLVDFIRLTRHRNVWSKARIDKYKLKALKRIVRIAKAKSPYYKKTLNGYDFDSLESFSRLPETDKTVLMKNFGSINTVGLDKASCEADALRREREKDYTGYFKGKYVLGLSSGTSGNRGIFITPKSLTKRLPAVFLTRGGVSLSDLPLRITFMLRVFSQGFEDINAPFVKLKYLSTMTPPEDIVRHLNENRTNVLMAPPSLLRFLAPLADRIDHALKRVITYAEVLTKEDKEHFEMAFKTEVVEIYQASEGQIASPCKEGHLHINEDLIHVEIEDENGNPVTTPHKTGHRMVVTNLVNTAQPLIRYVMNDMVVLDDPCPCGSSFRRIESILGRQDDVLYVFRNTTGTLPVFPDLFARWIITESEDIREFQVVQKTIGDISVTIDAPRSFDPGTLRKRILRELSAFGANALITVKVEPLFLPKDRNKFKRFICTIPSDKTTSEPS